ncbi:GHMP kinase [Streptomyces sp. TS71-3]|uniref:GHMP family kinase ATP-binding protein n=1 Tax=Streptomyces sp. TS71-3 TaxID=2733862 RepID=UPI001B258559|nr:GHMP kinase [Streptomyces sp. TS71-3]GHJ41255.1 kinase [Streptomyces sp. TS71-3]
MIRTPATGHGRAGCHHGEILQGVFRTGESQWAHGLVTLPLHSLGTRARFAPRPGVPAERITVEPADRTRAARAATLAVRACAPVSGLPPWGGHLTLQSDVPVGLGMGSSTSDVLAAVRAVADSHGVHLERAEAAGLAVRAERACDPLMLGARPALFAQRKGMVIEEFGSALPPLAVVGCLTGRGAPVDTLSLPVTDYRDEDVDAYERLRRMLRTALADTDAALLGRVATESAQRHQRIHPKAELALLIAISESSGALGVQVAHSGNVAGLLFDPTADDVGRRLRDCLRALLRGGLPVTRLFRTDHSSGGEGHGPAHRGGDRTTGPRQRGRWARLPAV